MARILKNSKIIPKLLPSLGASLITGLFRTCRLTELGKEHERGVLDRGIPCIFATWHYDLLYIVYYFRGRRGVVMTSPSADGGLMSDLVQRLGYAVVRGSKMKGGRDALREMVALVGQGYQAGLAADGSQGPARAVQNGILILARETGVPLIPVMVNAWPRFTLNTWDGFIIPRPFSRAVIAFGPPCLVPPDARGAKLKQIKEQIQCSMDATYQQVQDFFKNP
ncbi:MAG: lysophospholipid acyltransferase family protein [Deltaproteobacteria bacterium]|nr:lysophospholipid acyltransferase family protein [Deltaproteobacteria bacterium]